MSYNLLKGKKGIIFGALNESSIAWRIAEKVHEEGGEFILSNARIALRLGKINELAKKTNSEVIIADVTSIDELEDLIKRATKKFGKLDYILHSVGMSKNVVKKRDYYDLNYEDFVQAVDISAISLHKLLQTCYKMDALKEFASVVTLSYIGAQRAFTTYSDMSQAKALLESVVRSFGYHYGVHKNVRINSISQSPTKTSAGQGVKGFDSFYHFSDKMSPLGNASADECADYVITLFSDLTKKVTMQNLFHDGGFSSTGISTEVIKHYKPDCDCTKDEDEE